MAGFSCPCGCGATIQPSLLGGSPSWRRFAEHWSGAVSISPSVWRVFGDVEVISWVRRGRTSPGVARRVGMTKCRRKSMSKKRDYHVVPRGDDWAVQREGGERASLCTVRNGTLIDAGRDPARRHETEPGHPSAPTVESEIATAMGTILIRPRTESTESRRSLTTIKTRPHSRCLDCSTSSEASTSEKPAVANRIRSIRSWAG